MRYALIPIFALLAIPAAAQEEPMHDHEAPRDCVLPQQIAPSFNNTPAAMEQSRIAANTVRNAHRARGGALPPICGSEHDPRSLEVVEQEDMLVSEEPMAPDAPEADSAET
ncbi:hypothetical protein [Croceicoccus pelagius]|uniref:Uncharacterized protein n=1 Tax=Croceicoccus pelagius TaxID=1703341 RepID=A0A916YH39_9SPHN|nr:hypothetical protein [Croceicoccus pelagius]GGD44272.1 hypothetical protein GCM10010989_18030 [Croceicoccus pelagius]